MRSSQKVGYRSASLKRQRPRDALPIDTTQIMWIVLF